MFTRSFLSAFLITGLCGIGCGDSPSDTPEQVAPDAVDAGADTGLDSGSPELSRDMPDAPTGDMRGEEDQGVSTTQDMPADMQSGSACAAGCRGDTPLCDENTAVCVACLAASDCGSSACDPTTRTCVEPTPDPDLNADGALNILVLGTSRSIAGEVPFDPEPIAAQLQSILDADPEVSLQVNIVAEDIYASKSVLFRLGSGSTELNWDHSRHSLTQYYHWPEGFTERLDNLAGRGDVDWDHVIMGADPHIVATLPGYYALGANKIAAKVAEGGAQPHLLMTWSKVDASIDHIAEHTRRVSDRAIVPLPTIAAGLAWSTLPDDKKDSDTAHPTSHGAYIAAASIYAALYDRSASTSGYTYDDGLAQAALDTQRLEATHTPHTEPRAFMSPFKGAGIADRILSYNHTGTSSERGILGGLRWVLAKARVELINGGPPPIHFNYGRANTNFESDKRYQIDPSKFDFSMGFPMQDGGLYGDESMLYGLDKRLNNSENGTDLGVALYMAREGELPYGKAIPIRTMYAQIRELNPMQSAYRDNWHMHRHLDKASGAFMYTLLTGHCALDEAPADVMSTEWEEWMAHKVGYEAAWTMMHLSGVAPCFKVLPESVESTSIAPAQTTTLSISFMTPPTSDVTVTLSTDNDAVVMYAPTTLVFTPLNYNVPQEIVLTGVDARDPGDSVVVTATTSSSDVAFNALQDHWRYDIVQN